MMDDSKLDLDAFPTYTLSPAYRRGMKAGLAGKPITACKCRRLEAIADWRMGWRDAQEPKCVIGQDILQERKAAK